LAGKGWDEKTWQDAVGVPFSQGEALCERWDQCVVLRPGDRQVRKTDARKLDDVRSPLAFLLGKSKLEKELQGLSLAPDVEPVAAGDVVLRGVPQALADRVSEILLEVTPEHRIARIVIDEVDGSATEYRFSEQKENVAIPEGEFQFSPPPGTETIEGELGP
jgi:outer membrane lipoprotein carrier protein